MDNGRVEFPGWLHFWYANAYGVNRGELSGWHHGHDLPHPILDQLAANMYAAIRKGLFVRYTAVVTSEILS